jgi:DNA mismatch repair ATPase MutS
MRVLLTILTFTCFCVGCVGHPSDQTLEDRFRSNESRFEELLKMLNEDSDVARISKEFAFRNSGADPGLSKERLEKYRELFKVLSLEGGVHREDKSTVRFIASTNENVLLGNSAKLYLHSEVTPSPLVDSLDEVIKTSAGKEARAFKKLYGSWYLSYESW